MTAQISNENSLSLERKLILLNSLFEECSLSEDQSISDRDRLLQYVHDMEEWIRALGVGMVMFLGRMDYVGVAHIESVFDQIVKSMESTLEFVRKENRKKRGLKNI